MFRKLLGYRSASDPLHELWSIMHKTIGSSPLHRSASLASSKPYDGSSSTTELAMGAFAAFVPVSVIAEPLAAPPLQHEPCRRCAIELRIGELGS